MVSDVNVRLGFMKIIAQTFALNVVQIAQTVHLIALIALHVKRGFIWI